MKWKIIGEEKAANININVNVKLTYLIELHFEKVRILQPAQLARIVRMHYDRDC